MRDIFKPTFIATKGTTQVDGTDLSGDNADFPLTMLHEPTIYDAHKELHACEDGIYEIWEKVEVVEVEGEHVRVWRSPRGDGIADQAYELVRVKKEEGTK